MYCQNLQAALNYTVHELVEARRPIITLTTPKGGVGYKTLFGANHRSRATADVERGAFLL